MSKFFVGDEWYGKSDTDYRDVKAKIIRVTKDKVYVLFDRLVGEDQGRMFSKRKFKRLFSKNGQMNLFKKD